MRLVKEHQFANKKLSLDVRDWYNMFIISLMKIYFNMFGSLIEHQICNNLESTCIVILKSR